MWLSSSPHLVWKNPTCESTHCMNDIVGLYLSASITFSELLGLSEKGWPLEINILLLPSWNWLTWWRGYGGGGWWWKAAQRTKIISLAWSRSHALSSHSYTTHILTLPSLSNCTFLSKLSPPHWVVTWNLLASDATDRGTGKELKPGKCYREHGNRPFLCPPLIYCILSVSPEVFYLTLRVNMEGCRFWEYADIVAGNRVTRE